MRDDNDDDDEKKTRREAFYSKSIYTLVLKRRGLAKIS